MPRWLGRFFAPLLSQATGVDHIFATSVSRRPPSLFLPRSGEIASEASGVGSKQPPTVAPVGRTALPRSNTDSWRDSVAQPSKVSPGFGKGVQRNVLCEHERRATLGHDASHLRPQVSLVGSTEALAGGRPWLAGEAAADDVDAAAPGAAVEGPHVVEDRERRQEAIELSVLQHLPAVAVELDCAEALVAEQHAAEDTAADAGKQMQFA